MRVIINRNRGGSNVNEIFYVLNEILFEVLVRIQSGR